MRKFLFEPSISDPEPDLDPHRARFNWRLDPEGLKRPEMNYEVSPGTRSASSQCGSETLLKHCTEIVYWKIE
jgi:hypothetical protein